MKKIPELSYAQVKSILSSGFTNNSYIAKLMYPDVQVASAAGKLWNKLNENGRFRFMPAEREQLIKIVSREYFRLLG